MAELAITLKTGVQGQQSIEKKKWNTHIHELDLLDNLDASFIVLHFMNEFSI